MRTGRLLAGAALLATAACFGPDTPVAVDPGELPPPVLRGLGLEPLVATPTEPMTLTVEATGTESDRLRLRFYPPPVLERDGAAVNPLLVYDDGTHGDVTAGDGVYTLDGLEPLLGPDGVGSWPVYLVDVQNPEPGSSTGDHRVKLAFRGVDPERVPPPAVVELGEGARATSQVLVLEDPGAGDYTREELAVVSRRYYDFYPDDRQVLVVLHPPTFDNGSSGGSYRVRNQVSGIGLPLTSRPEYGSAEALDVVIQIWGDVFSSGAREGGRHCLLVHEMLHTWAAFLPVLSTGGSHWRDVLAREESGFGRDGVCRLNDLELYLAGLLPADSVQSPVSTEGMTMDELVARVGPRIPAWEPVHRELRMGMIAVHRRPLSLAEITYMDAVSRRFAAGTDTPGGWAWATGGRSGAVTALPEPGASMPPAKTRPAP